MKKSIKLLFLLCLSLTFVISLASCFGEEPGPSVGEPPKEEIKPEDKPSEVTKYSVMFDTLGGSTVDSIEVESGNKISEPTPPTKEGCIFLGWFIGDEEWDFSEDTVTENIYLFAKWALNSYKVTFVVDEDTSTTESFEYDSVIDFIPTKQHYEFKGWTLSEDSDQVLVDYTMPAEDITLYAKWEFVGSVGLEIDGTTLIGIGTCTDTDIIIPSSVTSIGDYAFSICENITSITFEEGSQLLSIGYNAFSSCSSLTSIEIPSTVTSIGEYAFYDCESLTSIEIPSGVTNMGNYMFYNCASLASIEIPSTVTSIGDCAFGGCSSLTSIEIPASVLSIGYAAFAGCISVTSMVVDENNTVYDSRENCNAIIQTSDNALFAGCQSTVIPNTVTSIANGAFYDCESLKSIEIPSSITMIGTAFYGCTGLTSIEIPASVTGITEGAFDGCINLTSIKVDENNPVYDSRENCNAIINSFNELVFGCQSTIIPDTVTGIGIYAFSDCSTLTSLEIPSSVTYISMAAFSGCKGLTSIEIPSSVTYIGDNAFYGCISLTSIEIPSAVARLYNSTFSECSSLTRVSFIGDSKLVSIGDYVFSGCSSLTNITIPSSVTYLGEMAFYECTSLTKISIPSSITQMGRAVFYNCTSLENVLIGESLTTLPRETFYGCTSLKSITIPRTITTIANDAFRKCTNLTSIVIPGSLKIVESYVFSGCTNLKNIYYELYEQEWEKIYLYDGNTLFTSATVYFYNKTEPTEEGNYWHYVDGIPTIWYKKLKKRSSRFSFYLLLMHNY